MSGSRHATAPSTKMALSTNRNSSVFSSVRTTSAPKFSLPPGLRLNERLKMEGLNFLRSLPEACVPVAFFDPQYRGVLDKLQYGNEGKDRGQRRCRLEQMSEKTIAEFTREMNQRLMPSGHLFLWTDKFHLCNGFRHWLDGTNLDVVDMINWDKEKIGMGYRSRRTTEYCIVLQKQPRKAKGVWTAHDIPDTYREKLSNSTGHPHKKPVGLQARLIDAVSNEGDIVIDPAAGDFTVLDAALKTRRNFLGCDLNG